MTKWNLPLADRLDQYSIPEPNSGCFLWFGAVSSDGYGSIRIQGKTVGAHRAAYELAYGEIPEGLSVLHRCDMPGCINPDHLFPGTPRDNTADMDAKGRRAPAAGAKNPRAILTEEEVQIIRVASGSPREIADRFGVVTRTVADIRCGKRWRHLPWPSA